MFVPKVHKYIIYLYMHTWIYLPILLRSFESSPLLDWVSPGACTGIRSFLLNLYVPSSSYSKVPWIFSCSLVWPTFSSFNSPDTVYISSSGSAVSLSCRRFLYMSTCCSLSMVVTLADTLWFIVTCVTCALTVSSGFWIRWLWNLRYHARVSFFSFWQCGLETHTYKYRFAHCVTVWGQTSCEHRLKQI